MRLIFADLVAAAVILASQPVGAQTPGDPEMGHEVARRWCSNCHMVDDRQQMANDSVPTFATIARKPTTSAASLKAFVQMPHDASRMPDFHLSEADADNVVAYLLSLRQ